MNCIYFTKRMQKNKPYFFCRLKKQQIIWTECKKCLELKYKEIKPIQKKSKRLAKLENNRFSIITDDLKHCYICTEQGLKNIPKDDLHEVYGRKQQKKKYRKWLSSSTLQKTS